MSFWKKNSNTTQTSILSFFGKGLKKDASKEEPNGGCSGDGLIIRNQINNLSTNVPHESDKMLICFTDGSCIHNGKPYAKAGYGVVWPYHPELDIAVPLYDKPNTNNRAEYSALIKALEQAKFLDPSGIKTLVVYTDSELLIKSMTKWLSGWKRNGWKKVDGRTILNKDLVMILDRELSKRKVSFKHVRAHTGANTWEAIWNDKVDILAKSAAVNTQRKQSENK
jgi:ribonuclease HI